MMEYRLLGPLEVLRNHHALELPAGKPRLALALLLLRAGDVVSTDVLREALWSDQAPATAANALQGYVAQLRRVLGHDAIATREPGYALTLGHGDVVDVDRLQELVRSGRQALAASRFAEASELLSSALALYRGTPLSDFRYEPFAQAEIGRLGELRLACQEDRIEADLALARHAELVGELETLVAKHPLREQFRSHLMLALYRSGRQAEALETYRSARTMLVEELGIEPGDELQRLYRAILNQDPALVVEPSRVGPKSNLPSAPTPLIGRAKELAELAELLGRTDVRLLTLTGPGGIGKTRLALALAEHVQTNYADGASAVFLAPVSDASLVVPSIAKALGLREAAGRSFEEALEDYLRGKELLLLIDNLEHVLEAAAALAGLVAACSGLTLLATSRAPLNVRAEHVYPAPPLTVPEPELADVETVCDSEAVALYVARAQAAKPDFSLTGDNAWTIAEICRRLEGIPLALELAAARAGVLPPAALLERLDSGFALLTGGAHDLPARQRSLRGTIAWSYELLDETERTLFGRLAVFAGGARLAAAENVCASRGELDVLDGLTSLVEKSLVRVREASCGASRFYMLAVIREYALERLEVSGETEELKRRHTQYFLSLAEEEEPNFRGPRQLQSFARLTAEHENIRTALEWAGAVGETELELRLAGSLLDFWLLGSYLSEGRRSLERALARSTTEPAVVRAKALLGLAVLTGYQLGWGRAQSVAEEALALYHDLGDRRGVALTLLTLGNAVQAQGDAEQATTHYREAQDHARAVGDQWALGLALNNLGLLAADSDRRRGAQLLRESVTIFRELGVDQLTAFALVSLGEIARRQRRYREAVALVQEGLQVARDLPDVWLLMWILWKLAEMRAEAGDEEEAARLMGAAAAAREGVAIRLESMDAAQWDGLVAGLENGLGRDRFAAAWAEGRALSLEDAVAYATRARESAHSAL
jgi:predicted ATPase/DNA-binding SARP family transcriptional activator